MKGINALIGAIEKLENKRDYTEKGLTFEEAAILDRLIEQAEYMINNK